MKRIIILGIIVCSGLLLAPIDAISNPAGPAGGLDVKIVNPLPVPVTGNVTSVVTGEVKVTNDAAHPVPVTGEVKVTNDAAHPVPVTGLSDTAAVTPVIVNITQVTDDTSDYTVPAGHRLKVTYISVNFAYIKNISDYNYYIDAAFRIGNSYLLLSAFDLLAVETEEGYEYTKWRSSTNVELLLEAGTVLDFEMEAYQKPPGEGGTFLDEYNVSLFGQLIPIE